MSGAGDTACAGPRSRYVSKMRCHDYLYDSTFIVSGARDYARTSFKAAMTSAQLILQPVYSNMFSETKLHPRMRVVYHPNCRLPDHVDRSYNGYLHRIKLSQCVSPPQLNGKDSFKYVAAPRSLMPLKSISPDFHPATPSYDQTVSTKPKNKGTQSVYRESSAQTVPWQPDAKAAFTCETTPEVLHLDKLEWGPGKQYRTGDLPADFHTTEIINKMRHNRKWMNILDKGGDFPRWMKRRDEILIDVETNDWIFREAEIDELQGIRLELLHRLQSEQREQKNSRTSQKLAKLWSLKKQEMEKKIDNIRRTKDRERRKLVALYEGGGAGLVSRLRSARGAGSAVAAAQDPTSDMYAPLARHGYQASRSHGEITYDPALLSLEDHRSVADPPPWLHSCSQDLTKTCSGHHLPRDPGKLCERETKWSEQFLESLHDELKMARLGAANMSAGPLRILKPRKSDNLERPPTPQVDAVSEDVENAHQCALVLQRILRGRAVQCLMYEGRTRAAELTEELKTTHGLQKEDKIRIAREEGKAREYIAKRNENDARDSAISALVDELCGGALSAALDFLEKELRTLKEERRQHAFILVALREKAMREAAEAGRRQKEEHRRREHDEMFKMIVGVTQNTVDAYLNEIIVEGVELAAEEEAVQRARAAADKTEKEMVEQASVSTAEEHEIVAELVQQFLLPHTHKMATRHRIQALQNARIEAARSSVFGVVESKKRDATCKKCGHPLGETCRCVTCPKDQEPQETEYRHDWRWKKARERPRSPAKSYEERFPMPHEMRCMLSELVNDAVVTSRHRRADRKEAVHGIRDMISERMNIELDARHYVNTMVDIATGSISASVPRPDYTFTMRRIIPDAIERTTPPKPECPKELPSELRRHKEELEQDDTIDCRCDDDMDPELREIFRHRVNVALGHSTDADDLELKKTLLPSEVRALEEMRKCKCDTSHSPSPEPPLEEQLTEATEFTSGDVTNEDLKEEDGENIEENF